jgi:hypothetical protein
MSRKFNFEVTTLSTDQISEMTTEEIQRQIFRTKRAIKEAIRMGYNTIPHEVEYCYLDHERQERLSRTEKKQINNKGVL